MTLHIAHNGFHGWHWLKCHPIGLKPCGLAGYAIVSARVGRRLNAACCGIASCVCYEGVAFVEGDYALIPLTQSEYEALKATGRADMEKRGCYPQG